MSLYFGGGVISISTDGGTTWTDLPPASYRSPPIYESVQPEWVRGVNGKLVQLDDRYKEVIVAEWKVFEDSYFEVLYEAWLNQWVDGIKIRPHKDNTTNEYDCIIRSFKYEYLQGLGAWKVRVEFESVQPVTRYQN